MDFKKCIQHHAWTPIYADEVLHNKYCFDLALTAFFLHTRHTTWPYILVAWYRLHAFVQFLLHFPLN